MTERHQDIEIDAGDAALIEDNVSGADVSTFGVIFRLFDYRGGPVLIEKTDADSGTMAVDSSTLRVKLEESDTGSLDVDTGQESFYYKIKVVDNSSDEVTVTTGDSKLFA